jgi:hypothetical protein
MIESAGSRFDRLETANYVRSKAHVLHIRGKRPIRLTDP